MFNNKLQMDKLAEAVKKVMDEAELDETGFHKAAHAAAKQGLPHFMFQGKKYPSTAKSQKEAIEIDEEQKENHNNVVEARFMSMRHNPWSQSAAMASIRKQREYKDSQLAARTAADSGENPDHPANKSGGSHDVHINGRKWKTFSTKSHADNVAKKIKGATVHSANEETEYTFKDKLIESLKENKATGTEELFTDNNIGEMSDAQMKKREGIVMSMKSKQSDFKKKYGARWKDVMYATATKMAMKEEGDCVTPPEAKNIAKKEVKGHEKKMHHEDFDLNDFSAEEIEKFIQTESFDQLDELSKDTLLRYVGKSLRNTFRHPKGSEMRKKRIDGIKMATDKLKGVAEGWDKLTPQQKAHEYNLDAAQREMDRRHAEGEDMTGAKIDKKTYQIIKPKQRGVAEGSLNEFSINRGDGDDVNKMKKGDERDTKANKLKKEEVELDEKIDQRDKTVDMLRGRVKVSPNYDNEHKSYKVKLSAEDIMGDTGWVPKKATQTDKSGATHSPISRAKHLAQLALQRTKKK